MLCWNLGTGFITVTPPFPQAWIASSVEACVAANANTLRDLRPLNSLGMKEVFWTGLRQLLFGPKLLNNEHDLPETYLWDVWRLCSLQRKLRIDASALCWITGLTRELCARTLWDTDNGRLALELAARLFLSVDYGTRVNFDSFLLS